ncbi:MAG: SH3 domain-containing protein [Eubacteriaceae bacterium]|nr:SH3 domain-containing protein [Eubacteriaceae bacterium]
MKTTGRKSIVLTLILAVLITMTISNYSFGEVYGASAPQANGKTLDAVYVRKSPSTDANKLALINEGTGISISYEKFTSSNSTAASSKWYYLPSYKGYVRADLATISYKTPVTGKLTEDGISVRKGAGTSYERAYTWNKGKSVNVVLKAYDKTGNIWYKIRYNSKYYYIYGQYVSLTDISTSLTTTTPSLPKGSATLKTSAYIRKSADSSSAKGKLLSKGTKIEVSSVKFKSSSSSSEKRWYYVPAYNGYLRADWISLSHPKAAQGKINDNDISIRKGAGTSFAKAYTWNKGKVVNVVLKAYDSTGKKWYKIKYNGNYYYVSAAYVTLTGTTVTMSSGTTSSGTTQTTQVAAISTPEVKVKLLKNAYVRKSAKYESEKLALLKAGEVFDASSVVYKTTSSTASDKRWYYIPAYKGYIRADWISLTHRTPVQGKITEDGISVRKGAGTSFAKAYTWNKGKTVNVVLKAFDNAGNKWYKVKYNGKYYYIRSSYVAPVTSAADTGIIATGKITEEINVRTGPGTQYSIYKTLNSGTSVNIYGKPTDAYGTVWYKIKLNDKYYYVCSDFVKLDSSTENSADQPTKIATGVTTDNYINLRTGPGSGYSVYCTVNKGVTLDIYKKSTDSYGTVWYKVLYKNSYFYICADYVKITSGSVDGSTTTYPVSGWTTDDVNVRKGAGTSYAKITTLSSGTKVTLTGTKKDTAGNIWYSIDYSGQTGYIIADYITTTKPGSATNPSNSTIVSAAEFKKMLESFPESYRDGLTALHEAHPTWRFTAKNTGLKWSDALAAQCRDYTVNLTTFKGAYRKVANGTYDFENHTYIGFDGPNWVAASNQAVAFYMDPRNWLTESGIFMFENMSYNGDTQTESVVRAILSKTAVPVSYSSTYMEAGQKYNISPVYLASKTYLELGSSDYMINGKYNGCYNAFNIGATDSADGSAANKGLQYAAGSGSYGRPWNTLRKAILGGANFIARGYIANNQYTQYYERFNVLNGINCVGTHQYATAIHNAATLSSVTQSDYRNFGMLSTGFSFEIPVYENMPLTLCKAPSVSESNNNYLDSLKVSVNGSSYAFTTTFSRFTTAYVVKSTLPKTADEIKVTAKANDSNATITVSGNTNLQQGVNLVTVKVKSTSGLVRTYKISVTRK